MGRKIFWLVVTSLGLAGLVWWWTEEREPRGFSPQPRPRPRPASQPSSAPGEPTPRQDLQPRRCIAVTRGGERCSREARPGSDLCWQHAG